jgi:hypothetical protein
MVQSIHPALQNRPGTGASLEPGCPGRDEEGRIKHPQNTKIKTILVF